MKLSATDEIRRYLSGTSHTVGGKRLHYRDVLLLEAEPGSLGISSTAARDDVRSRLSELLGRRVTPTRLVILRRAPRLLVLILEVEPSVHPSNDLTLEEIVLEYQDRLLLRPRRRSLPMAKKRASS